MNCVPLAKHAWRFAWHLGRTARPSQASLLRLSRFSAVNESDLLQGY